MNPSEKWLSEIFIEHKINHFVLFFFIVIGGIFFEK